MNLEMFLDASLFIGIGVLCWYFSYKTPIQSYKTKPVESFDKWYIFIALFLVMLMKTVILIYISEFIINQFDLFSKIQTFSNQLSFPMRFLLFFLIADFGAYWAHRFLHSPFGWRFHSMHHGIENLNWISGVRGSPFHYFFILLPVVFSQVLFLNGVSYWSMFLFLIFDIANQHFCHSNIKLKFEKELEYLFITPRMHLVHHHPEEKYTNSNYGLYLSIWDHIFKTYTNEENIEQNLKGQIGLDYKESMTSGFFCLDKRSYELNDKQKKD